MNDERASDDAQRDVVAAPEEPAPRPGVSARNLALAALVLIAPFALHYGVTFFIPLLVSIFLSFVLSPAVEGLERWRVPRAIGSGLVMTVVIAITLLLGQLALNGATEVIDELPRAVQKLRLSIASWERDGEGALKQVRRTADELQKLAGATATGAAAPPVAPATPPPAAADPKRLVEAGTVGMAIFIGQIVTVFFLTYFLLAAGDLFRRRLLQVQGPSLTVRKKTLQILREVHSVSRRYFALLIAANIAVGAATFAGLYFLDVRHPLFWGIAMAVMHSIPYVGTAATAGALGLIAYLQFESFALAFAAAAVPIAAAALIGVWLSTVVMARASRMNAVSIFVALLFWGMVWGGWGLLLAFPIMATAKIIFGEIERLKPLALLMSGD